MKTYIFFICAALIFSSCAKDDNPIIPDPDPEPELARISGKLLISSGYSGYDLFFLDSLGSRKIPQWKSGDRFNGVWGPNGESVWCLQGSDYVYEPVIGWQNIDVHTMLEDGTRDTIILQSHWPDIYASISISPDGNYLAAGHNPYLHIYRIVNASTLIPLDSVDAGLPVYQCWWSPDSRKLIYEYYNHADFELDLIMYNVVTRGTKNLTKAISFRCVEVSWASASDKIAVQSKDEDYLGDDIYTINIFDASVVNLTHTPDVEDYSPEFAPTDDRLVYVKYDSLYHLILLDINTGEEEIIVPGEESIDLLNTRGIIWSSNGNEIIFHGIFENKPELRRVRIDSLSMETIYRGYVTSFNWFDSP